MSSTTLGLLAVVAAALSLAAPASAPAAVRAGSAAGGAVAGPAASAPARSVTAREVRATLGPSLLTESPAPQLLPLLTAVVGVLGLAVLAGGSARHGAPVGAGAGRPVPSPQGRAPPERVVS